MSNPKVDDTSYDDIEIYELTQDEVDILVDEALREADTTIEELRRQGKEGRFDSEKLRSLWFMLQGFGKL